LLNACVEVVPLETITLHSPAAHLYNQGKSVIVVVAAATGMPAITASTKQAAPHDVVSTCELTNIMGCSQAWPHLVVGHRHSSINNLADGSNVHVGQPNLQQQQQRHPANSAVVSQLVAEFTCCTLGTLH
jgi:hypothetical protein